MIYSTIFARAELLYIRSTQKRSRLFPHTQTSTYMYVAYIPINDLHIPISNHSGARTWPAPSIFTDSKPGRKEYTRVYMIYIDCRPHSHTCWYYPSYVACDDATCTRVVNLTGPAVSTLGAPRIADFVRCVCVCLCIFRRSEIAEQNTNEPSHLQPIYQFDEIPSLRWKHGCMDRWGEQRRRHNAYSGSMCYC